MPSLILTLLVVVVVYGCGGYRDRCSSAYELEATIGRLLEDPKLGALRLEDLTTFKWSRLDAFGEYSPVERIKARTGLDYRASWWQDMHVPESRTLLVFSDEGGPVCYVEVKDAKSPDATWSFGPTIFTETGVRIADARFIVDRGGEIPILDLR